MLLVHDDQPGTRELDFIFDERVGPDHQLHVVVGNVAAGIALLFVVERAGEQGDAVAGGLKQASRREVVLGGQDLGGGHERGLVAVLDGNDGRFQRHDGLARADVALQQAAHGRRTLHVLGNLLQHPLLRRGRMEGQHPLEGIAHAVGDGEGDARLGAHIAPLHLQSDLEKKQFLEDEAAVRRRARALQVLEPRSGLGKMRQAKSFAPGDQVQALPDGAWNAVGQLRREVGERAMDDAAEPARAQPAIGGGFVDGHDAPDLKRLSRQVLRRLLLRFRDRLGQDLELRLHQLDAMAPAAWFLHPAIESDRLSGLELISQVGGIEPYAGDGLAALAGGHLVDFDAAPGGAEQAGAADFRDDGGHLAGTQLGDAARIDAVLVTEGQIVEQVLDRADALAGQDLRQPRADSLDVLHRGVELEHRTQFQVSGCKFQVHRISRVGAWITRDERSGGHGVSRAANPRL